MDRLHAVRETKKTNHVASSIIYPSLCVYGRGQLNTRTTRTTTRREGIKLRNATFVIAGGPVPNGADAAAPAPAAAQVLRFLEKHPLRGAILIGADCFGLVMVDWHQRQNYPHRRLRPAYTHVHTQQRPNSPAGPVRVGRRRGGAEPAVGLRGHPKALPLRRPRLPAASPRGGRRRGRRRVRASVCVRALVVSCMARVAPPLL